MGLTPAAPVRILVVDDSVVVRQLVARVLDAESSTELVGVAANGRVALEKIARLRPDVVLLGLETPEMGGFETLTEIRRLDATLPVIVLSDLGSAGAAATLAALALGATGVVLKPSVNGMGAALEQVRDGLVAVLQTVVRRAPDAATSTRGAMAPHRAGATVSVVVIAASTGGPDALATVIPALPADIGVPILIVQHMPTPFTSILAERLDRLATLTVVEAADAEPLVPGRVYVAPGGRHLSLTGTTAGGDVRVRLTDTPAENSCRPAADVLFRAAATVYGAETLAVVLTGMGRDGLRGSEAVRAAGGYVIAQTEDRAVAASMPAAVAEAGLTDAVVPLERMACELVRRIMTNGPTR